MTSDLNNLFIDEGVYKLKAGGASLFVCKGINEKYIGKLEEYEKASERNVIYEKTGNSYFLNGCQTNDLKAFLTNRQNYEMVGKINNNYYLSCNDEYLVKN